MSKISKRPRKSPSPTAKAISAPAGTRLASRGATGRSRDRSSVAPSRGRAPAPKGAKPERFAARLSASEKRLIEDAAALQGRTLTDFVLASAQEAAQRVLRDAQVVTLAREASIAFARALQQPPAPNASLRRALRSGRTLGGV